MKQPLAARVRPRNLDEFVGQEHLTGVGMPLRLAVEKKNIPSSMIFWGPPGSGKTTLARMIARAAEAEFIELSAVSAGKADVEAAINKSRLFHKKTILFLDEIHRFNKAQQDFLLPSVENGNIILIGATTENPSFEVISALLSRSRVFVLNSLTEENLAKILRNALSDTRGFPGVKVNVNDADLNLIANIANGDARSALNILEMSVAFIGEENKEIEITKEDIQKAAQKKLRYDKNGEEHYNIISALHKSMRDSDPQGATYWTMRMVEGGEDPEYIIRRMIRFASEDIGNADPRALEIAVAAMQSVKFLGYPECNTALVQTATYLANAPKSNSVYMAVNKAKATIERTGNLPVPLHLRNAETGLMREVGYGKGYKYAHDYKDAKVDQEHLPEEICDEKFYEPSDRGEEKKIIEKKSEK